MLGSMESHNCIDITGDVMGIYSECFGLGDGAQKTALGANEACFGGSDIIRRGTFYNDSIFPARSASSIPRAVGLFFFVFKDNAHILYDTSKV